MSDELSSTEIHSFYEFLGRRIEVGGQELSPEQSVQEYRLYREEVERFIRETKNSIASGPAEPLDHDAVRKNLADKDAGQNG